MATGSLPANSRGLLSSSRSCAFDKLRAGLMGVDIINGRRRRKREKVDRPVTKNHIQSGCGEIAG